MKVEGISGRFNFIESRYQGLEHRFSRWDFQSSSARDPRSLLVVKLVQFLEFRMIRAIFKLVCQFSLVILGPLIDNYRECYWNYYQSLE